MTKGSEEEYPFLNLDKDGVANSWVYPADDDKDGYYSLYVNTLRTFAERTGCSRAAMIEALLTIPLTSAPDGWYQGFTGMMEEMNDGNHNNVFMRYVNYMKRHFGKCKLGEFLRCQQSAKDFKNKREVYQSMRNLDKILKMAENGDIETKRIVRKLAASVVNGGVHNVGQFYAQVLINIATKIDLLKNKTHSGNIVVSTSTTTYKRLKAFGVKTPSHAREIVPFLSHCLCLDPEVCENKLCEWLRRMHGNDGTMDYFVWGHVLYKLRDGVTIMVGGDGLCTAAPVVDYIDGVGEYKATVQWWDDEFHKNWVMESKDGDELRVSLKRLRIE